jgi:hypothetical protein
MLPHVYMQHDGCPTFAKAPLPTSFETRYRSATSCPLFFSSSFCAAAIAASITSRDPGSFLAPAALPLTVGPPFWDDAPLSPTVCARGASGAEPEQRLPMLAQTRAHGRRGYQGAKSVESCNPVHALKLLWLAALAQRHTRRGDAGCLHGQYKPRLQLGGMLHDAAVCGLRVDNGRAHTAPPALKWLFHRTYTLSGAAAIFGRRPTSSPGHPMWLKLETGSAQGRKESACKQKTGVRTRSPLARSLSLSLPCRAYG